MSKHHDITEYVKDPSLLADVCRHVIESLDSVGDDDESREKEAQLREIAKTIERLEKAGVAIPDALRGEKTRLASDLAIKSEGLAGLNRLADELEEVLRDLKTRISRDDGTANGTKPRRKRSRSPKTDKQVLREQILKALKKLGGSARVSEVIEEVGKQLDGKLLPGDLEWRDATEEYAWQNNVKWERFQMIKDGLLRSDSQRGHWQLSEDHT